MLTELGFEVGAHFLFVVDVVNGLQPHGPLDGLEDRLTFEEVERERDVVLHRELFAFTVKFRAARTRRADAARRRDAAELRLRRTRCGEVQKNIFADDWRVAFQHALKIRMPQKRFLVRVRRLDVTARVATPRHERHTIAIRHRDRVGRDPVLHRHRVVQHVPVRRDGRVLDGVRARQRKIIRQRFPSVTRLRQFGFTQQQFICVHRRARQLKFLRDRLAVVSGQGNVLEWEERLRRLGRFFQRRAGIGIELRRRLRRNAVRAPAKFVNVRRLSPDWESLGQA